MSADRTSDGRTEYLVREGRPDEAAAIHAFAFGIRSPKLRWRTLPDIQRMLDAGAFYVIVASERLVAGTGAEAVDSATVPPASGTGDIIATCYVQQPAPEASAGAPAEYGGALVHESHRRRGIGELLGSVALADHHVLHPDTPVMAHVRVGNEDPRSMLARLGFVPSTPPRDGVDPSQYSGLEHMATAEDGLVYADLFDLPPSAYRARFDAVLGTEAVSTPSGSVRVRIDVLSYTSGVMLATRAALDDTDTGGAAGGGGAAGSVLEPDSLEAPRQGH